MAKKYKIAYILTSVSYGGLEKVSSCFLETFNQEIFDIYPIVFTRPWQKENSFIERLEQHGVQYYQIASAKYPPLIKKDLFKVPRRYFELYNFLKNGSFDLVHSNGTLADLTSIPIARMLSIPCISTCHGFISNSRMLKIHNALNKLMLRKCNKIISVSDVLRDELVKDGVKESLINIIPNAVKSDYDQGLFDLNRKQVRSRLNINESYLVLGFIGRLSIEKGGRYFLEAVRMIKESQIPVKALVIGEGPQRIALEALVARLGIESEVIFTGFQSEIEKWLPALDFFVLPSLSEGTPMALLEAMSFGVTVIATRVGGVPNVIESDKNGILVNPGKPEEIADAVTCLLRNEPQKKIISGAGRETIQMKYSVEDWAQKIESEYLELLKLSPV